MVATPKRTALLIASLAALFAAVAAASLAVGPVKVDVFKLLGRALSPTDRAILLKIRLPRILLGGLVGGVLAAGGVVFQAVLKNPLAEPYILGLSSGAAVGAIASILMGLSLFPLGFGFAFIGGAVTIVLVLAIARGSGGSSTTTIILAGVIVNAFFGALIMLLVSLTQDERIHTILFWLMGDLGRASLSEVALAAAPVALSICALWALARPMNVMSTGEETAFYLGVEVEKVKVLLLVIASLMTGTVVALAGVIGFVGLIVPHILRRVLGPDNRLLVPSSFFFGASFLVACDTLARSLTLYELPVGVVSGLLGGPFFLYILAFRRAG